MLHTKEPFCAKLDGFCATLKNGSEFDIQSVLDILDRMEENVRAIADRFCKEVQE